MYNPQHKLISYLKSKGIVPQAYSPLGSAGSPLIKDEKIAEIAKKLSTETEEIQPADVLLGWLREFRLCSASFSCFMFQSILSISASPLLAWRISRISTITDADTRPLHVS